MKGLTSLGVFLLLFLVNTTPVATSPSVYVIKGIVFEERWYLGRVGQIYRDEVSMARNRAHDHLWCDNRAIVKSHRLAFDEHFVMLSRLAACEPCSALEKQWFLLHLPEVK